MRFHPALCGSSRFISFSVQCAVMLGTILAMGQETVLANRTNGIELEQKLSELESHSFRASSRQQQERLMELERVQLDLMRQFQEFTNSPEIQEAIRQLQSSQENIPLDELTALQNNLQQLEHNAVVLYPLVLDDRLELILVNADTPPIRRTLEVSRTDLNQAVLEFRQALTNPSSDPLPAAQQLYQWLIQPFEAELLAGETDTILYAPGGVLRYVPLSALHNGEQWLAERYVINRINVASLTELSRPTQPAPRVLAAAHTEGAFDVEVGDRTLSLSGFPFAKDEVEAIAHLIPNTTVLLNETFSREALLSQMNSHTIVHLAAHTWLIPSGPAESFILLGDGNRIPLSDIGSWQMPDVDLVVLSACETGIGGELGGGDEILGLPYLFQQAGAEAVITPLWQVDDFATKELMVAFYQAISQGNRYGEALQQAQQTLIASNVPIETRGATVEITPLPGDRPSTRHRNLAHPYYWAPFVLTGNGL